jgi:CDP-diacylglycerol--glycerol-3-phosphate 3-phosphatidyltransferase
MSLWFTQGDYWLVTIVFILIGLLDGLDGWVARRLQQESALGELMDPVVDKCASHALLWLLLSYQFSWLMMVSGLIILIRDVVITSMRFSSRASASLKVSFYAKVKSSILFLALSLQSLAISLANDYLSLLGQILTVAAAGMAVKSFNDYFRARWQGQMCGAKKKTVIAKCH